MAKKLNFSVNGFDPIVLGSGSDASKVYWGSLNKASDDPTKLPGEISRIDQRINSISTIGRYLSEWNCATGLSVTAPTTASYAFQTGDYYIVSIVAQDDNPNYKPYGTYYTGVASEVVETEDVTIGSTYVFDGTNWILRSNEDTPKVNFGSIVGEPTDNLLLAEALGNKEDIAIDIIKYGPTGTLTEQEYLMIVNQYNAHLYFDNIQVKLLYNQGNNIVLGAVYLDVITAAKAQLVLKSVNIDKTNHAYSVRTVTMGDDAPMERIEKVIVSSMHTFAAESAEEITATAPSVMGYKFSHWEMTTCCESIDGMANPYIQFHSAIKSTTIGNTTATYKIHNPYTSVIAARIVAFAHFVKDF